MAKRKFYSLTRYIDKVDGNVKTGYIRREGYNVPNEFGYELAVYKKDNGIDEIKWYVVDVNCGLSVGDGDTKKEAIENCFNKLRGVDKEKYMECSRRSLEKYGQMPGHGIMYL